MAGGNGAQVELFDALNHRLHLAGHRCHQAVVEVAAVFFGAAAVGLGEALAAEVGGEELAADQQAACFLEDHQAIGPARGGCRDQAQGVAIGQSAAGFLFDHLNRRQGWDRNLGQLAAGGAGFLLAPELRQQAGAGVGAHQLQLGPAARQLAQQGHPVGVDVADHDLQGCIGGHQGRQLGQEGLGKGGPGRVHQQGPSCEQEAVGSRAPLQAVFHLEAQPAGAEPLEADQPRFQGQLDDAARAAGVGRTAHQ